jgi:hypothetical protein
MDGNILPFSLFLNAFRRALRASLNEDWCRIARVKQTLEGLSVSEMTSKEEVEGLITRESKLVCKIVKLRTRTEKIREVREWKKDECRE